MTGMPYKLKTLFGKTIYRIFTLVLVNFQWVVFNSQSFTDGARRIKKMLIYQNNNLSDNRTLFLLKEYMFFIVVAVILCFPLVPWIERKTVNNKALNTVFEMLEFIVIIMAFVWALSFVVAGQNNPFAYANF